MVAVSGVVSGGDDLALKVDAAGVGLDAALFAAAAGVAADDDFGVADLAGVIAPAAHQLALVEDGAPDAGAHEDGEDVLRILNGAGDVLAPELGVEIVDDGDLVATLDKLAMVEVVFQDVGEGDVSPVAIGRVDDVTARAVEVGGEAEADRLEVGGRGVGLTQGVVELFGHGIGHLFRGSEIADATSRGGDGLALSVEELESGIGPADVESSVEAHGESGGDGALRRLGSVVGRRT